MRVLTIEELMHLTPIELCDLLVRIKAPWRLCRKARTNAKPR